MLKHTSGPWKVDRYGIIMGGPYFCTSIGAVTTWQSRNRAKDFNDKAKAANVVIRNFTGGIVEEAKGNQRLIEIAPDLWELCQKVMEVNADAANFAIDELQDLAKAAIAKVKNSQ